MSESQKLAGKVAIITDVASGIGRATAILFQQPGAFVTALSEPLFKVRNSALIGKKGAGRSVRATGGRGRRHCVHGFDEAEFVSGVGFNVGGGAIVNF